MTKNRKVVVALGILAAGVIAAGGSAFTNSVGLPATKAGYGTVNVTGANVLDITYNTNAAGDKIETVSLKLQGDRTGPQYRTKIGFNTPGEGSPTVLALEDVCNGGGYTPDAGNPANPEMGYTLMLCDNTDIDTSAVVDFRILVTNS